jgi:hypothetical protein
MRVDRERGESVSIFLSIQPGTRRRIETAIERVVEMLDFIDGDPDLEPDNDDEPSVLICLLSPDSTDCLGASSRSERGGYHGSDNPQSSGAALSAPDQGRSRSLLPSFR